MVSRSTSEETVIGRRRLTGGFGALMLTGVAPAAVGAKSKKRKTRRIKQAYVSSSPVLFPTTAGSIYQAPDLFVSTDPAAKIVGLTLVLDGFTVSNPTAVDIFLIFDGSLYLVMSDVGGINGVSGLTLKFSETAKQAMSVAGPLVAGTYRPTNNDGEDTDGSFNDRFIGFQSLNKRQPVGPWGLQITTDTAIAAGAKISSWRLEFTLDVPR